MDEPDRICARPSGRRAQAPSLPIERCGRSIVRCLRAQGYPLAYLEFDGGHVIPPEAARAAVDLLRGRPGPE